MTLRLFLMRHAKSSWDSPLLADHDRPLNNRGRASAKALGTWLKENGYVPDAVLSSTAKRTHETFEGLDLALMPTYTKALYHAGASQMLEVLRGAQGACVLVLGHNPGIAEFAERLVSTRPSHPRFFDYPTGATTIIDFDVACWKDVEFGKGTVRDFMIPRELPES